MSDALKSKVIFVPTEEDGFGSEFQQQFQNALVGLMRDQNFDAPSQWALKIPVGVAENPNPVSVELLGVARDALLEAGLNAGPSFANLSITTEGLHTAEGLAGRAEDMGLNEFRVGDDPAGPVGTTLSIDSDLSIASVGLPAIAAEAGGLLLINAVRPHPFMGMDGALFSLGSGVVDRATKLVLHRPVKPTVDTPLCAGCGSCLAVCIFDALTIRNGRAMIDHQSCTGCGECMNACHLGGIGPENGADIPRFQKLVAESAYGVATESKAGRSGSLLFANFLTPLSRQSGGSFGRDRFLKGRFGVLLSSDPVALDQATWDILIKGAVHGLRQWSGFLTEPRPLLERAEALKIGRRQYELLNQV